MKRAVLLVAVAALSGCATRAPFAHTLLGATGDQILADTTSCQELSRTGTYTPPGSAVPNPALSSPSAAAFGSGFAEGLAKGQAQRVAYERCMADRGYLQTTMTPEERAAYRALKTVDERKAWMANFSATDHGERSVRLPDPAPCKPNMLVACATPN